jgi:putative ATP-dependent endonuclease of OLD family
MHISRVEIKNYRNFRSLLIDPFPENAVIVGVNGVGKSNLLDALRLVLDPSLPNSARQLQEADICEASGLTLDSPDLEVSVDLQFSNFENDPILVGQLDGCIIATSPMVAQVTYLWRRTRTRLAEDLTPLPATVADFSWQIFGGGTPSFDAGHLRRDLPLTVLPALRDAVRDLEAFRGGPLGALVAARPPSDTAVQQALTDIAVATTALSKDPALTATGKAVATRLTNMAGRQMQVQPTLGFSPGRADQLVRSLRLFIDVLRTRSVADTSSGSANVIYLALLLQRLTFEKADEDTLVPLLAVEEPEAHLHPSLQRQLFGYLLRQHSPLILTTHSPHIAAVAEVSRLVMLVPGPAGSGTFGATVAGAGLTSRQQADLNRFLDVTRAEVVFAGTVILVEGPTEIYVLTAIAAIFGFHLEEWGVVVTSVAGVDFLPLHRLLGDQGLRVPHVIVTDGDADVDDGLNGPDRAVAMLEPEPGPLTATLAAMRLIADPATWDLEPIRTAAEAIGVFVGTHTLETDMCALFAPELEEALILLGKRRSLVRERVTAITAASTPASRTELLKSVGRKGETGQRLAEALLKLNPDDLLARAGATNTDELIANAGSAAYLLRALDHASRLIGRGRLYEVPAEEDTVPEAGGPPSTEGEL